MTRTEFRTREAEMETRIARSYFLIPRPIFSGLYLAMTIALPTSIVAEVYLVLADKPDVERIQVLIAIVFFLGLAFAMQFQMARVRRVAKQAVKELELFCPSCRKSLFRKMKGDATACPACGKAVLE